MRILYFSDGRSVHTSRWLRAMVDRGVEVYLATDRPEEIEGVTVIPIICRSSPIGRLLAIPRIRSITRNVKPDIVHGHYLTSYGLWAILSGIQPVVLTAWGSDVLVTPNKGILYRYLTQWVIKHSELVTADAANVLDAIKSMVPESNIKLIQWGIDIEKFPEKSRENDNNVFNLLSLRFWEKNYHIGQIIEAFAKLVKEFSDYTFYLHLVGGGSLEENLRNYVERLDIQKNVIFHGRVSEAEIIDLLKVADLTISVPESDATAMSLLESMACEVPVIASDIPANREWIEHKKNGWLVPVNNTGALLEGMKILLFDKKNAIKMGIKGRIDVVKHANRRIEMDRMYEYYESLCR